MNEATEAQGTSLATQAPQTISLPALINPEEALAVMEANLEGVTLRFDRVKIPSGGGLAFQLQTEEGPVVKTELDGVILDHYPTKAHWEKAYSGKGVPPDCYSFDCVNGMDQSGKIIRKCQGCEFNRFGTAIKQDGTKGRGKACKDMHRLYLLQPGEMLPLLIALPPTSLGNFGLFAQRLASKLKLFYSVVTRIKLQEAQSKDNITYSQVLINKIAEFRPEEIVLLKKHIESLKPAMRAVPITSDDYEAGDDGGEGGTGDKDEPF